MFVDGVHKAVKTNKQTNKKFALQGIIIIFDNWIRNLKKVVGRETIYLGIFLYLGIIIPIRHLNSVCYDYDSSMFQVYMYVHKFKLCLISIK